MEVLNLENEPILFLPIYAISDNVIGKDKSVGINLSVSSNRFFKYLNVVQVTEELASICSGIAADRTDEEPGVIMITQDDNLAIVCQEFTDQFGIDYRLPVLWNAKIDKTVPEDEDFYLIYLDDGDASQRHEAFVSCFASDVFWSEESTDWLGW